MVRIPYGETDEAFFRRCVGREIGKYYVRLDVRIKYLRHGTALLKSSLRLLTCLNLYVCSHDFPASIYTMHSRYQMYIHS